MHSFEVHYPYAPKKEYLRLFEKQYGGKLPDRIPLQLINAINYRLVRFDQQDLQHIINIYDAGIYATDKGIGLLMNYLKKEGLYDKTMIIITADHGGVLRTRRERTQAQPVP